MSSGAIVLTPGSTSLEQIRAFCFQPDASLRLTDSVRGAVDAAARCVHEAANGSDAIYGVNTGFGKLAQVRIAPADTAVLQRNLILSHCSGVGEVTPETVVRLTMALKLLSL